MSTGRFNLVSLIVKKASLSLCRNTGIADKDGNTFINKDDVLLLGKLGFNVEGYGELTKTSEVLDLYSYIEKVAGVPKAVARAVDRGEAFSGSFLKDMGYSVPKGYEIKGDLCCPVEKTAMLEKESFEKTAKADPSQTILVTGHSGAGKSTLAKALAEKLNLPLHRVDAQTSWDDLRAHFEKNPEHERKALTPGSAEHKQYTKDVRKIVRKSLGEINGPAVLEGTQVTTLSPNQLAKYKASILVGGDMEQSIAQRLQRTIDKAAKKGVTFTPEELAKKKEESKLVADSWHPGMEKFKKVPGVINYNHTEHKLEPLIERLQGLMGKKAEALVVSGIHGDEPAGNIAAKKLDGKVDAVTDVNPTEKRRFEGKDINRHFDKPSEGSVQKKLLDLIEAKKPSSVISLHEDDEIDKPYAYSSKTMADKVKEALKGKRVASSAHGDVTDNGVISEGKNPPDGSLEKALDKRDIPHATIETPSKSEGMEDRVKTHLDVVKDLLSKEAAERTYYHGSPMAGLKLLEPKLDPRQNVSGLFIHENPEIAALFALMPERHKATHIKYNTNTEKPSKPSSNFEVTVPHDKWLRDSGSLYEVSPPKGSVEFDPNEMDASGSRMLEMPVSPVKETKVTLQDLIAAGLKINVNDSQKLNKTAVAAWQRSEGKNPEGGLNAKGRASYKRETGGTLKAPVTESNPKGERASRQNSFCARMCGMKSKNTGNKAQSDPDSRINKSLRKWNCKCGEDHDSLFEKVACLVKESKGRCWEGYKPVPGKEPYSNDSCEPVGAKKKKDSELEKEAGATPERIRELILKAAKGCKDSSACLSRMSASRKGRPASSAAKVKPAASLPTVQPPADAQGMLPFAASHEFEVLKHKLDPSYALNPTKYLGKQAGMMGSLLGGFTGSYFPKLVNNLYERFSPSVMRNIQPLKDQHLREMVNSMGLRNRVGIEKPKLLNVAKGNSNNAWFNPDDNSIGATSMRYWRPNMVAHELGHAQIHNSQGPVSWIQRNLYKPTERISRHIAPYLGAAAGYATPHNPMAGMLLGGTAGALTDMGRLIPEFEASRRGIGAIMRSSMPFKEKLKNSLMTVPQFLTYASQSIGSGAAAGGLSSMM